jgi:hypothetical protein
MRKRFEPVLPYGGYCFSYINFNFNNLKFCFENLIKNFFFVADKLQPRVHGGESCLHVDVEDGWGCGGGGDVRERAGGVSLASLSRHVNNGESQLLYN